jgi:hypothetical protein
MSGTEQHVRSRTRQSNATALLVGTAYIAVVHAVGDTWLKSVLTSITPAVTVWSESVAAALARSWFQGARELSKRRERASIHQEGKNTRRRVALALAWIDRAIKEDEACLRRGDIESSRRAIISERIGRFERIRGELRLTRIQSMDGLIEQQGSPLAKGPSG